MTRGGYHALAGAAIVLLALSSFADAQTARRHKKQNQNQEQAAAPASPADKRDRAVVAPGTPFNGKPYWQAAAQCGGIYFRLGTVYSDSAVRAKVTKPDPAAYTAFTKQADEASKTATVFFTAAERFLVADRKLGRDEAVMTYDPLATQNGDRLKTVEAAVQAAQPCAELYKTCRGAFPQLCNDSAMLTN
jgi:hypothetical protein